MGTNSAEATVSSVEVIQRDRSGLPLNPTPEKVLDRLSAAADVAEDAVYAVEKAIGVIHRAYPMFDHDEPTPEPVEAAQELFTVCQRESSAARERAANARAVIYTAKLLVQALTDLAHSESKVTMGWTLDQISSLLHNTLPVG